MLLSNRLRPAAWVSLGLFVLMLIGSIVYYKDRMLFADASHIAFAAINEQKLQIQQFRFGAAITQMVPIIGAWLGLSVKNIMMAYSASFNLFYLAVACSLMFYFRNYRLVVLFALYWALITTHTFFWPNNEVHQGIAYMFLLFALLERMGKRKLHFAIPVVVLFLLGGTAIFCHPLVIAPFVFLWVYQLLEKKHWHYDRDQTLALSAIVLLLVVFKLYVSVRYAGYDSAMLWSVRHMQPADLPQVFNSSFAKEVYRHFPINYWQLPILSAVGIICLISRQKYTLLGWMLSCLLAYFTMLCLTYRGYIEFGSESELMPAIIIACAAFVFEGLMSIDKPKLIAVIVGVIFILRFEAFYSAHWQFLSRTQELSHMVAKMKQLGITKLVLVKDSPAVEWTWMADWGFAAETMMLGASIWDKPIRHIVLLEQKDLAAKLPANNSDIITTYQTWPATKLDFGYFSFDTSRPYIVMRYEEFKALPD